jgi:MFS transporter, VNT family, synaptic vesicle glycoprotein 2
VCKCVSEWASLCLCALISHECGANAAACVGLSGLAVLFLFMDLSSVQVVGMLCLFSAVSTGGWNTLDIVSAELFPTAIRSSAFGMFSASARVGAIAGVNLFGLLIEEKTLPILLVGILLCIGAVSSLMLPRGKVDDIL